MYLIQQSWWATSCAFLIENEHLERERKPCQWFQTNSSSILWEEENSLAEETESITTAANRQHPVVTHYLLFYFLGASWHCHAIDCLSDLLSINRAFSSVGLACSYIGTLYIHTLLASIIIIHRHLLVCVFSRRWIAFHLLFLLSVCPLLLSKETHYISTECCWKSMNNYCLGLGTAIAKLYFFVVPFSAMSFFFFLIRKFIPTESTNWGIYFLCAFICCGWSRLPLPVPLPEPDQQKQTAPPPQLERRMKKKQHN